MIDSTPVEELAVYSPRMGKGDRVVNTNTGKETLVEDVMVSLSDGEVYYEMVSTDNRDQFTLEAKHVDKNYQIVNPEEDK